MAKVVKTVYNYFYPKNNGVIFFVLISHHKIGIFIQKKALYETARKCNFKKIRDLIQFIIPMKSRKY